MRPERSGPKNVGSSGRGLPLTLSRVSAESRLPSRFSGIAAGTTVLAHWGVEPHPPEPVRYGCGSGVSLNRSYGRHGNGMAQVGPPSTTRTVVLEHGRGGSVYSRGASGSAARVVEPASSAAGGSAGQLHARSRQKIRALMQPPSSSLLRRHRRSHACTPRRREPSLCPP